MKIAPTQASGLTKIADFDSYIIGISGYIPVCVCGKIDLDGCYQVSDVWLTGDAIKVNIINLLTPEQVAGMAEKGDAIDRSADWADRKREE